MSAGTAAPVTVPVGAYLEAERRVVDRYGIDAERRMVDVPAIDGEAGVLVSGHGPAVMMVVGGGPPVGIWIPLMAELTGFTLYAVELPGLGLTSPTRFTVGSLRHDAVTFLDGVAEGLGLEAATPWISQSMGALWTFWLALDRPERVRAIVSIGCPATLLHTSAPFPFRLASTRAVGRLLHRLDPPSSRQVDRFIRMAGEAFADQDEMRRLFLAVERLPTYGRSLRDLVHAAVRLRGARSDIVLSEPQLAGVNQPVQLIWGERDPFGRPAVGRRATRLLPDAELHVVPGGHAASIVDDPSRVASLVAPFLARHGTTPEVTLHRRSPATTASSEGR